MIKRFSLKKEVADVYQLRKVSKPDVFNQLNDVVIDWIKDITKQEVPRDFINGTKMSYNVGDFCVRYDDNMVEITKYAYVIKMRSAY